MYTLGQMEKLQQDLTCSLILRMATFSLVSSDRISFEVVIASSRILSGKSVGVFTFAPHTVDHSGIFSLMVKAVGQDRGRVVQRVSGESADCHRQKAKVK